MKKSAGILGLALLVLTAAVAVDAQEKLDLDGVKSLVAEGKKQIDRSRNTDLDATARNRAREQAMANLEKAHKTLAQWCDAHPEDLPAQEDLLVEIARLRYQLRKESAVPIKEKPVIETAPTEPGNTVEFPVMDLLRGRPSRLPQRITGDRPMPSGGFGFYENEPDDPFAPEVESEAMRDGVLRNVDLEELLGVLGVSKAEWGGTGYVRVPSESASAAEQALARLRAHRPGFVDIEYRLKATGPQGSKILLSGQEPIPVYETTVFADTAVRSYVSDWDVEIAQASEIPDPILYFQRTGTSVAVRVRPLPFAGVAIVEVRATTSSPEKSEPIDLKHPDFGKIDRAAVAVEEAIVSFRVENGKPASHVWTGRDGRRIGLDLTVRWQDPAVTGNTGAILWTPLLTQSVRGFEMVPFQGRAAGAEFNENWRPRGRVTEREVDAEALLGRASGDRDVEVGVVDGATGLAIFQGGEAALVRDRLVRDLAKSFGGSEVSVQAVDVPAGAPWAGGAKLPETARTVALVTGPVLPGLSACFLGADERNFVQDWDVEVAQGALIADPIVSTIQNGHYFNVRVIEGVDGRPSEVLLDLQFLRLDRIDTEVVPIKILWGRESVTLTTTGKSETSSGMTRGPNYREERAEYIVEKPFVRELRISSALPLGRTGRAVLRRAAPGFLGEGRELVVVVTAN